MAVNFLSYDHTDDDYIDMEVSSYSSFRCQSKTLSPPPQPREFEFQMSSISLEKEPTTSPADELFYKGKLLPLHLPPRLQMVEKLLQHSDSVYDDFYSTPLMTTATTPATTTASTPFESCNISPSESCRVSREINPDEYFFDFCDEVGGFNGDYPKKSWTKKLKLIKQSSIGSRLKASRAYLKALFGKSGCSDDSCTAAAKVADEGIISRTKAYSLKKVDKAAKKTPFGQIQKERSHLSATSTRSVNKQKIDEDGSGRLHRRSFSMTIKRHSTTKSSSSSSSSSTSSSSSSSVSSSCSSTNRNGFHGMPFLKRSNSVNSEVENPIQGAIAHCKQSQAQQQLFRPRNAAINQVGFYSSSASELAIREEQERPELGRG